MPISVEITDGKKQSTVVDCEGSQDPKLKSFTEKLTPNSSGSGELNSPPAAGELTAGTITWEITSEP
jgi:hypothetical protein